MQVVKFVRTIGACQEEYGQIRFDGEKIRFDGLTCVFQKYLEKGITGPDNRTYRPVDGIQFPQQPQISSYPRRPNGSRNG